MTQEEKQLLLKDLCVRLPYGVKVLNMAEGVNEVCELDSIMTSRKHKDNIFVSMTLHDDSVMTGIEMVKPYLRPMSSMTEEEREEWADLFNLELDKLNEIDDENEAEELAPYYFGKSHQVSIDWLNEHYFDYCGLIEKGLALEAPKGMYK